MSSMNKSDEKVEGNASVGNESEIMKEKANEKHETSAPTDKQSTDQKQTDEKGQSDMPASDTQTPTTLTEQSTADSAEKENSKKRPREEDSTARDTEKRQKVESGQTAPNTASQNANQTNASPGTGQQARLKSLLEKLKQKVTSTKVIVDEIPKLKPKSSRKKSGTPKTPTTTSRSGRNKREKDFFSQARNEYKAAYVLVTKTMGQLNAWPFNKPVDPVALGIPDYNDIVKTPMDLGTVKENIISSKYSSLDQIEHDVNLVFSNCRMYNAPGTDVVLMADQTQQVFTNHWHLVQKAQQNNIDVTPELEKIQAQEIHTDPPKLEKKTRKKPTRTGGTKKSSAKKKGTTSKKKSGKKSQPPKASAPPMTFHEKKKLTEDIGKLDTEQNFNVLRIIRKSTSMDYGSEDEVTIDLDNLDPDVLRELQDYVKSCIESKKKAPPVAKPLESNNGAGEETDTSSDDSDSSSDDSSDDEGKNMSAPLSMSSIV